MHPKNLPVPPGPVAPLNLRYFWYVAPPALITEAYRLIPPRARGIWSRKNSTSHLAMRLIMAGGGWSAFWICARPHGRISSPSWFPEGSSLDEHGFPFTWFPSGAGADDAWPPTIPARMLK